MKNTFIITLMLIGFLAYGQEKNVDQIDTKVNAIESNSSLVQREFDLAKLSGVTTDDGWILKVWQHEKQLYKIVEEIALSYGRIKTVMYLNNGIPIKIIEIEENFSQKNGELNYKELNEVFRVTIYVFDWENDQSTIQRIGERIFSEGSCSTFEYEPIIERAKKAITE